jgi:type I restriction enzyme, S subunit
MKVAGMRIDLPSDWQWSKCNDVMDVRDGTHDTPKYTQFGFPLITSKNLKPDGIDFSDISYISEEDHRDISKRSKVDKNDILFAMIGTIGNPVIVETDKEFSVKNVALFKFARSSIDPVFFKYLLGTPIIQRQLINETRGGTQKFVSLTVLRNMLIPYPPLEEQKRIAAILDKADRVRRKRQEAIRLTEELGRSIFLDMFGDPVTNSKGLETKPLGNIVTFLGGGTPARNNDKYFQGEICWASSKDMGNEILVDTQEHITQEAIDNSSTKLVPSGTLLIVVKSKILMKRLPVSRTAIDTCFNQDIKAIVPKDLSFTRYLQAHLKLGQETLLRQARGVNTEGLTLEHLRKYPVLMPKQENIIKFTVISKELEKMLVRNRKSFQESENLFNSLLQRAFRGEL